jgi:hypothetical protein
MGTVSVDVDIDVDDILEAMSEKQRARLYRDATENSFRGSSDIIRDAVAMIRR